MLEPVSLNSKISDHSRFPVRPLYGAGRIFLFCLKMVYNDCYGTTYPKFTD
jgi:hypothetical protein